MKASELREFGGDDLQRKLAEMRGELFKLKLRMASEQLPNPLRLRMLRRDIARCLTVIHQKQAASAAEPTARKNG
jgi:large subunit ribosomal protein L29